MERDETRDPNWKREQWASDEVADEGEHKPTWNRHQWASDNPGTSGDTIGVANADADLDGSTSLNDRDAGTADMEHISGRGKASGESHFERNDPTE
jgi:hypothetical protein